MDKLNKAIEKAVEEIVPKPSTASDEAIEMCGALASAECAKEMSGYYKERDKIKVIFQSFRAEIRRECLGEVRGFMDDNPASSDIHHQEYVSRLKEFIAVSGGKRHIHKASDKGDSCAVCRKDIRNGIHLRVGEKG